MTVHAPYVVERAEAGAYGPVQPEGAQVGEIRALSAGSDGALRGGPLALGPATHDYFLADDEAFVGPGRCRRHRRAHASETTEAAAGDVAHFVAGTRCVRTVTQPFRKFAVVPALRPND